MLKMLKSYNAHHNCCILGALYRHNKYIFVRFCFYLNCVLTYGIVWTKFLPNFAFHIFVRYHSLCVPSVCDLSKTCKQTHVGRGPLLVLGDTALQVEGQVVAADLNPLPKLLLELPYVWLDDGEIQFLPDEGDVLKYSSRRGMIIISIIITCVSGSKVKSFRRASLLILDSISLAVCSTKAGISFVQSYTKITSLSHTNPV